MSELHELLNRYDKLSKDLIYLERDLNNYLKKVDDWILDPEHLKALHLRDRIKAAQTTTLDRITTLEPIM